MQRSMVLGRSLVSIPPFLHTRLVAQAIPRSHLQRPCNYTHRLHTNDGKPPHADTSGSDRQNSKDSGGAQKPANSHRLFVLSGILALFTSITVKSLQSSSWRKERQTEITKEEQDVFKEAAFKTFVIKSRRELDPENACLTLKPIDTDPEQGSCDSLAAFSKSGIWGFEYRESEQGSTHLFVPAYDYGSRWSFRIVVERLNTAGNYQHLFYAKSGTKIELRGPVLLLDLPKTIRNAILIGDGAGKTYISKAAAILRPRGLSNTYKFILLDEIKDTFSSTQKSKSWNTDLSTIVGVELEAFQVLTEYSPFYVYGTTCLLESPRKWKNWGKDLSAVKLMDSDSFSSALESKFEELMAESTIGKRIWDLAGSKVVIIAGCRDFLNQIENERTAGNIENQTRLGHALARLESLGWEISTVEVGNTPKFRIPGDGGQRR